MGASSGLGQEVAGLLYESGWSVGIAARRGAVLSDWKNGQTGKLLGGKGPAGTLLRGEIHAMEIDVCGEDAPDRLAALVDKLGGVDLYVHASGIGKQNPDLDSEIELNTVRTNCMGFTRMIDAVFGLMADRGGGHIAVISSVAGTRGLAPAPSYSAAKAFQTTYIEALEQLSKTRKLNIRFTDIRPGFVDTPLLSGKHYPMLMDRHDVARRMVSAVNAGKHVCVIDWRWRVVTWLWRLIPRFAWRNVRLVKVN